MIPFKRYRFCSNFMVHWLKINNWILSFDIDFYNIMYEFLLFFRNNSTENQNERLLEDDRTQPKHSKEYTPKTKQ